MPKWIFYTLATVLLWGVWSVVCKAVSAALPDWQLQVISLIGVLPIVIVLGWMVYQSDAALDKPMGAISLAAGLLGCLGNLACFRAMSEGGKALSVIPLTSLYPITTVILAMLFLKERPGLIQSIGIGLSLLAIWLFNVANQSELWTSWLLFALLPIVCWGVGGFIQKLATNRMTGEQCAFTFLIGFLPMAFMALVKDGNWTEISATTWGMAVFSGFLFALGNLTVILAYRSGGRAVIVTPAAGLYMLVTVPLAVLLLHESITWREGQAIVVSVLAVIALCYEGPPRTTAAKLATLLLLANGAHSL
jgi:bacterial/archaeal transporter family protein